MRAEQWCNSCGIAYWKLHSYPRSPSGPVLLAWMLKELQNELPFRYQVLPIGSILPSVSFGGCEVAQVQTWASERWVKGKFYAAASSASSLKKFSAPAFPLPYQAEGPKWRAVCQGLGKATLFPLGEGGNTIYWSAIQNLMIDHSKTLLRNKRLQITQLFYSSRSLLYFFMMLP